MPKVSRARVRAPVLSSGAGAQTPCPHTGGVCERWRRAQRRHNAPHSFLSLTPPRPSPPSLSLFHTTQPGPPGAPAAATNSAAWEAYYAATGRGGQAAPTTQRQQQFHPNPNQPSPSSASRYADVPPPPSLAVGAGGVGAAGPVLVRPAGMGSFLAGRGGVGAGGPPPAYLSVARAAATTAAAAGATAATAPGRPPYSSTTTPHTSSSSQQHRPIAAPASSSDPWPDSLRAFVQRAFGATPPAGRPALQAELRSLIAAAQASGSLWSRDWARAPLPRAAGGAGAGLSGSDPPRSAAATAAIAAATAAAARLAAGKAPHQHQQKHQQYAPAWPPSGGVGVGPAKTAGWGAVARARAGAGRSPSPPPPPPLTRKRGAPTPSTAPLSKKAARKAAKAASASAASKFGWAAGPPAGKGGGGARREDEEGEEEEDWSRLDPAERARRESRAGRFGSGAADGAAAGAAAGRRALDATAARRAAAAALAAARSGYGGGGGGGGMGGTADPAATAGDAAWDALAVKGTSTALEKSYFRLTAPPDPASVRPAPVLRAALDRLTGLVAAGAVPYFYAADQFKGLRQDCTVQRLRGCLTAAVYEAHARAALGYGDAAEYTQCQAQLEWLHREAGSAGEAAGEAAGASGGGPLPGRAGRGAKASAAPPPPSSLAAGAHPSSVDEFAAYRVLYQAMHGLAGAAGERVALLRTLQKLGGGGGGGGRGGGGGGGAAGSAPNPPAPPGPALAHALAVVSAASSRDGPTFFALYAAAPRCGRAVMDIGAGVLRFALLRALCGAVRPLLPLGLVARALGFCPPRRPPPGSVLARITAACEAGCAVAGGGPLPGCAADGGDGGGGGGALPGRCAPAPDEAGGLAAAAAWAAAHGAVLVDAATGGPAAPDADPASLAVDGRASAPGLAIPEDAGAVAHGDANLAVEDFLARTFK